MKAPKKSNHNKENNCNHQKDNDNHKNHDCHHKARLPAKKSF